VPEQPARASTRARRRLADAVRALNDAVLTASTASDAELDRASTAAEQALAALADVERAPRRDADVEHADYLVRSPVLGELNPMSPPFAYELDGPALQASGTLGAPFEGPPGYVHGGYVALLFDEVLGTANVSGGTPALTGRLTIRYRRPTPLGAALELRARTTAVDGRRVTTVATLTADGELTAEAEGLFVTLGAERALEYFGERPSTPEPTDPLP
jgi:acyl-coenzyme A thioesterase PaaI-like protein